MRRTIKTLSKGGKSKGRTNSNGNGNSDPPNKIKSTSGKTIDKNEPLVEIIDQSTQYETPSGGSISCSETDSQAEPRLKKRKPKGQAEIEPVVALASDYDALKRQGKDIADPDSPSPILSDTQAFIVSLLFRSISLCSQTFFQPDEFYQAYEPAHQLVFGTGYLTWEWRPLPEASPALVKRILAEGGAKKALLDALGTKGGGRMRSWLWPSLFAAVYKALQLTGFDSPRMIVRRFHPTLSCLAGVRCI